MTIRIVSTACRKLISSDYFAPPFFSLLVCYFPTIIPLDSHPFPNINYCPQFILKKSNIFFLLTSEEEEEEEEKAHVFFNRLLTSFLVLMMLMMGWLASGSRELSLFWILSHIRISKLHFRGLLNSTYLAILLHSLSGDGVPEWNDLDLILSGSILLQSDEGIRRDKFLEVPQIVWGLNNQKIAFARACLTARMLNRTLLMPSLSASLFYKEIDRLQPISFDKVFQFERFNLLCDGFVRLGHYSDLKNQTGMYDLLKGSGRKWTVERDLEQLKQSIRGPVDKYEVLRIVGKNPFLWHDHWPVKDYARVFECLVLVDEIAKEADKVVSKIRQIGRKLRSRKTESAQNSLDGEGSSPPLAPYVAVHMRVEIDWMIHCKKLEQRSGITQICSGKQEIMERVGKIVNFESPTVVYLAVADNLLNDSSILDGWKKGLLPFEKKKLGVDGIYKKHPYLIQSAIDYEVCLRADIFVGNSFSTFSSLIVLDRTQKMIRMGITSSCETDIRWPSYAYNIPGESNGPRKWMINMSDSSLKAISYGSNAISC